MLCNTRRVTTFFPFLKAALALQEGGCKKVQKKCHGPAAQAALHLLFCSCLGLTQRDSVFTAWQGRRTVPKAQILSFQLGFVLVRRTLLKHCWWEVWDKPAPSTPEVEQAKANIYPHPHFLPHLANWDKHKISSHGVSWSCRVIPWESKQKPWLLGSLNTGQSTGERSVTGGLGERANGPFHP